MIRVNYQAYGTGVLKLRLRIYKDGQTRYINVNKRLNGELKREHWDTKNQMLKANAPFSKENNRTLFDFKRPYEEAAEKWTGTLTSFILSFSSKGIAIVDESDKTLSDLFDFIIGEKKKEKHADGTTKGTFELYDKAERKVVRFCKAKHITYSEIKLSDINAHVIDNFLDWVEQEGRGLTYCSVALHSILMVADKKGWFDFSKVKNCRWQTKNKRSKHKHESLTREQCERFAALTLSELPKSKHSELYKDFCLFMLSTSQSPCDAIAMQRNHIVITPSGAYLEFRRRKISEKQTVPCSVPINADMQRIINKWCEKSKDDYIFPIRNKKTMKHPTNNYDIKKFISKLNVWLKKVGKILGLSFPLHSYVFRHTAITGWISQGVDLIYVANAAGTSVKNCETIYYNNMNDPRNHNKFLSIRNY